MGRGEAAASFLAEGVARPAQSFFHTIFIVVLTRQGQGQIGSRDQVRSYKLVVMFGRRCAIDAKSCGMNTTMEVLLRSDFPCGSQSLIEGYNIICNRMIVADLPMTILGF